MESMAIVVNSKGKYLPPFAIFVQHNSLVKG